MLAAVVGAGGVQGAAAGELAFPFHTDFDTAAGGTLSGTATTTDGWLRLTSAEQSQAGSWLTDDVFPSDLGLEIEFHYAMYGGTGADGLLMSLSDGAVAPGVGRPGASLGYNCYDDTGQYGTCDVPGMPGGFVGLGFDRFGNYSRTLNGSGNGPRTPEQVVVRGSGNGLVGYRFLDVAPAPGGGLETGSRAGERTVRVTLEPGADGVLRMTVRSDTGPGTAIRTVLDAVPLEGAGQAALPPTLRLGFAASTGSSTNVHEVDDLSVSIPTNLAVAQDMPDTVVAGTRVAYTATATNRGRNLSPGSAVTIAVPPELTDVHWTCSAGTGAACGDASGTGSSIETTADLDPGAVTTYTIEGVLRPDATGQIASTATVQPPADRADTDEADNVSTVRASIRAEAALTTEKALDLPDGVTSVEPGDTVGYTVTAVNHGPSSATQVGATDDLPARLAFAGSSDDCTAAGQLVTCRSAVTLAPGERHTFHFSATLDADYPGDGADVVNIAVASSPDDADGGDPSDPVSLVVDPSPGPSTTPEPTPSATPGDGATDPATDPAGDATEGPSPEASPDVPVAATPTATATPVPVAGGAGGPGAAPQHGALAYTGSAWTPTLVGVAVVALLAGAVVEGIRRRRRAPLGVGGSGSGSRGGSGEVGVDGGLVGGGALDGLDGPMTR